MTFENRIQAMTDLGKRLVAATAESPSWTGIKVQASIISELKQNFFSGRPEAIESYCFYSLGLRPGYIRAVITSAENAEALKQAGITPAQALAVMGVLSP